MSADPNEPLILNGEQERVRMRKAGPCFELVAFSSRSPAKVTPNEDSALAMDFGEDSIVLAVADGAGGLPAGQRASNTAIAALHASLRESSADGTMLRTAILNGIEAANRAVIALSNGSATTLTVVGADATAARCYQIGDSCAMLVGQRGRLKFQSIPHSPTGFAVEAGFLGESEALFHAERHVVSNFIGDSEMRIDIGAPVSFACFDTLILASDGLTDNVRNDEIVERIRKGPIDAALEQLTGVARERMLGHDQGQPSKPDDLTVLLMRHRRPRPKPPAEGED